MRNQLGNITDLGDGRFRVTVSLGYDKRTGKRIRPTSTIRGTKADAKRELTAMLARSGKLAPDKLTLSEFLTDIWLPTKAGRRQTTRDGYGYKVDKCIVPYIGHLPLKSVDGYVVERWLVSLSDDGYSPQTVMHARSVLRNAMRAAVRWHHIDRDPTEGTTTPRVDYRPRVLSDDQLRAYLAAFAGHVLEPVVILAIAAGLRRSELAALDWSDIDLTAGEVTVRAGLHQKGAKVWTEEPKSRTSRRTVALPPGAVELLRALRAVGPLVPDGRTRMAPTKMTRLYRDQVTAAKLPVVTIRELRNSHGTYLKRHGAGIEAIADRLGHSDTRVTKQHYVVRQGVPVDTATAALVADLFACQLVPDIQDKHGENRQETVNG